MDSITTLALADVAFVASHLAMSHPLRRPLATRLGENGFLAVYSVVGLAVFAWIIITFRNSPAGPLLWNGAQDWIWAISSLLTLLATAMLIGSFRGNPAVPGAGADVVRAAKAEGAFAVTRHPMMWGIALWALAHILAWPSARTVITAGAMGFLALVGAHMQDKKKEALLGEAWTDWEAGTHYWPRFGKLARIGPKVWIAALLIWLALTWLHLRIAGVPAGLWKWLG